MSLAPGTRLGPYEIVAVIGVGGMGEVYRARDPRLDREVAIKVLPADLATHPLAMARFEREAMTIARLSHPNVVAIYEFGRDQTTGFVVMELVAGETLYARLLSGALSPRRAAGYALQIARGLAAAHDRGIVHRDLKPANVMITRDDQVKILDFGLAKPVDLTEGEMTAGLATNAGTVLGTTGYMAPEQVRGLPVDHRADIFAFGAVLYEMLSGRRAFKGGTAADTMTAILTKDPLELEMTPLAVSLGLDRIARRCLEKTPELRFQSANDLAFALETFVTPTTTSSSTLAEPAPAPVARAPWLPWAVAALGLLAAAVSWLPRSNVPENRDASFASFTRISEAAGEETSPAISPDGGIVAYSLRVNGSWDIHSQRVGGRNATPIVNDPQRDERGVAFSPDGSLIAFHESDELGGIFVAGATGESVRRVTDSGFDPAWSPDGKQIAFATEEIVDPATRLGDSTLYVVDAAGGSPRKMVDGDAAQPSWSPSGQTIAYWSNTGGQRDIYTVAATGGGARLAVTQDAAIDWSPAWSPDGRFIYFASDRGGAMNLWRIAVDQATGRSQGAPEPVTTGVQASAALPRFSRDGARMSFRSRVAAINPVAIPFDPSTLRAGVPVLLDTQNNIRVPSDVSPDGKQLAFYSLGDQQEDIFIGSLDGAMRRVTDDVSRDRAPMFTPDGQSLVFYSNRDGNWALWMVATDGGNLRKVAGDESGAVYVNLSPKGDAVIFVASSGRAVFSLPLAPSAGASPTLLRGTQAEGKYFTPTAWSPDGTRLAGPLVSDSGRSSGIGTYDLAAQATTVVSADETFGVRWLADSRRVMYFTNNGRELVVLDTLTRRRSVVDVRLPGPATSNEMFAISPDNRAIYYGASRVEADIWIVERN